MQSRKRIPSASEQINVLEKHLRQCKYWMGIAQVGEYGYLIEANWWKEYMDRLSNETQDQLGPISNASLLQDFSKPKLSEVGAYVLPAALWEFISSW